MKISPFGLRFLFFLVSSVLLAASAAVADTFDQGGTPERFSGAGDNVPPRCQLELPAASTSPFFVKWNCADDDAAAGDIRTELWILRDGDTAPSQLGNFLGFPASIFIDAGILGVDDFQDGLPVNFRLLARDRAGNATISPYHAVLAQASALDSCTLDLTTSATDSTGETTGVPAMTVFLETSSITSQETGTTGLRVATSSAQTASTCEISSVCENSDEVAFSAALTLADDGTASGTLIITPGTVVVDVSGTYSTSNAMVTAIDVSGDTTVDGQEATATLNCS